MAVPAENRLKSGAGIAIRQPDVADIRALLRIEQTSFASDRFDERDFQYYLSIPNSIFFAAEVRGVLVGYICGIVDHRGGSINARLYSMAVAPGHRSRGIGAALLDAFEKEAHKKKCDSVTLQVYDGNRKAISLYESFGYVREAVLSDYYARDRSAFKMRKVLRKRSSGSHVH